MSEALARHAEDDRPAQRLVEMLSAGEIVEADKLTRELAAESVGFEPKAAETVRVWWLHQWKLEAEEEAEEIRLAWDAAANRVREAPGGSRGVYDQIEKPAAFASS